MMKKVLSVILVVAMLITLSVGVFACKGFQSSFAKGAHPGFQKVALDKATLAKIQAAKAETDAKTAPLKENLKTLYGELKTAKTANPVNEATVKSIKEKIAAVNTQIIDLQKALNKTIAYIKLVAKVGEEAAAKITAAKAAFAKEVAPLNEKLKALYVELKAAKSAKTVDKAAIAAIKEKIAAVNKEIMTKYKALNDLIKSLMPAPSAKPSMKAVKKPVVTPVVSKAV